VRKRETETDFVSCLMGMPNAISSLTFRNNVCRLFHLCCCKSQAVHLTPGAAATELEELQLPVDIELAFKSASFHSFTFCFP
jgi:hypothetical protein